MVAEGVAQLSCETLHQMGLKPVFLVKAHLLHFLEGMWSPAGSMSVAAGDCWEREAVGEVTL